MRSVFPPDIQNYNKKPYCFKRFNHLKRTYFILLVLLLFLSIALPFLHFKIYIPVRGILKIPPSGDTGDAVSGNMIHNWQKRNSASNPSPQTDLVVECYVPCENLKLIKKDRDIKFRSSFLKKDGQGYSSGQILQIEKTEGTDGESQLFKILCSLNINRSFLNKTTWSRLIRGIPLSVFFPIDNRSLFQLLFENLEDGYEPVLI